MKQVIKIAIVSLSMVLLTTGCAKMRNITGIYQKTCLVLSVGGSDGIAHIGAIEALKQKNIDIDCVVGNSMGSIIGVLYANRPGTDLRREYRSLMAKYLMQTLTDLEIKKILGGLLIGGLALALSGGSVGWETIAAALAAGIISGVTVDKISSERFQLVLDQHLNGVSIEHLLVPYATTYLRIQGQGVKKKIATTGNASVAVQRSTANPLIFSDLKNNTKFLDPGVDEKMSTPIEVACEVFHPSLIIAINASGKPASYDSLLDCEVDEIIVRPGRKADITTFIGSGESFEYFVGAGYRAVMSYYR